MPDPIRIFRIPGSPAPGANLPKLTTYGLVDTFERPDAPGALGVATDGKTWQAPRGVWGIIGGTAYVSGPTGSGQQTAVVETYAANGVLEAQVALAGSAPGLCFRYVDLSNHLFINVNSSKIRLWKRVANSATAVAESATGVVITTGDTIRVELAGTQVRVLRNGVQIIAPTTITEFADKTVHGLVDAASGGSRYGSATFTPSL